MGTAVQGTLTARAMQVMRQTCMWVRRNADPKRCKGIGSWQDTRIVTRSTYAYVAKVLCQLLIGLALP